MKSQLVSLTETQQTKAALMITTPARPHIELYRSIDMSNKNITKTVTFTNMTTPSRDEIMETTAEVQFANYTAARGKGKAADEAFVASEQATVRFSGWLSSLFGGKK